MDKHPLFTRLSSNSVDRLRWWLLGYAVRNPDEFTEEDWQEFARYRINRPK